MLEVNLVSFDLKMRILIWVIWTVAVIFETDADSLCNDGYYYAKPASTGLWYCEMCPQNTYRDEDMDEYRCPPCPLGYYTPRSGYSYCTSCPAGMHTTIPGTSCIPCPKNYFKPNNDIHCTACGSGYYTDFVGATQSSDCKATTTTTVSIATSTIVTSNSRTSGSDGRNTTNHDTPVTSTNNTQLEPGPGEEDGDILVPVLIGAVVFFALVCGVLLISMCFVLRRTKKQFPVSHHQPDTSTDHTSSMSLPSEVYPRQLGPVTHSSHQHEQDSGYTRHYHVLEATQYDECDVTSANSTGMTHTHAGLLNNNTSTNGQLGENYVEISTQFNTRFGNCLGTNNYDTANCDSKLNDVKKMAAIFSPNYSHLDTGVDSYSHVDKHPNQNGSRTDGYSHIKL